MHNTQNMSAIYYNIMKERERNPNHAEADYEANPKNAKYEERFEQAYKNEFKYFMDCVKLVQKISGGKIDFQTAKKLVINDWGRLLKLLDSYTLFLPHEYFFYPIFTPFLCKIMSKNEPFCKNPFFKKNP